MQKSDFYYDLPEELIAQTPLSDRSSSRLLTVDRRTGEWRDECFTDLEKHIQPGDCLVLNDTKVIPARIYGHKEGFEGKTEFLLLRETEPGVWETLVKPGRRAPEGSVFIFGGGELKGEVVGLTPDGSRMTRFTSSSGRALMEILKDIGEMPLPHYIREKLSDADRYQTVYCRKSGSVAAPTAGLHFTLPMLERLKSKGVRLAFITLHVGVGTFRPVKEDDITKHIMHTEYYSVSAEAAAIINAAKSEGKKVIAVGTTSCRTLESVFRKRGRIEEDSGITDIFIYPPFEFRAIDALVTNFHLPESTLIMLVSAFAGREHTLAAYRHAVAEKYRFFSFGDAMFIGSWNCAEAGALLENADRT